MQLYYYQDPIGNFGDDLNKVIWEKIWPDYDLYKKADWMVGIGSIFTGKLNNLPGKKLIMGSGYWPTEDGKPDLKACQICFVRGPLTCRELGLSEKLAITDTAVLVNSEISRPLKIDNRVGFMPHHRTCDIFDCARIAEKAGLRFIDPRGPVSLIMDAINVAPQILVEAMHGAIVADAIGVPWQRISLFDRRPGRRERVDFKWKDWGDSLNLDTTPAMECLLTWPGRSAIRRMVKKPYYKWSLRKVASAVKASALHGKYKMSNRKLLISKVNQLKETIALMKTN